MSTHNAKAYLLLISTILTMTLGSIIYFISDPDVAYDIKWYYGSILLGLISFVETIYILSIYTKIYQHNLQDKIINVIFCTISVYLLWFGLSSIKVNELTIDNQNSKYFVKNENNDIIAIVSTLIGFLTLFLVFIYYFYNTTLWVK